MFLFMSTAARILTRLPVLSPRAKPSIIQRFAPPSRLLLPTNPSPPNCANVCRPKVRILSRRNKLKRCAHCSFMKIWPLMPLLLENLPRYWQPWLVLIFQPPHGSSSLQLPKWAGMNRSLQRSSPLFSPGTKRMDGKPAVNAASN